MTPTDSHIIVEMLIANGNNAISVPLNAIGLPYPDVTDDSWVSQDDVDAVNLILNSQCGSGPGTTTPPPSAPPTTPPTNPPNPVQDQIVATDFDYLGNAPSTSNLYTTGFEFVWRMEFNQAAANLVAHQIVETTIQGFDANGTLVHTLTSQIRDILPLSGGAAPAFIDMQGLREGYQRTMDNWATSDGVTKFVFTRRGDMRLVDAAGIEIVNGGVSRPYNPGTDIEGMVFSIFDIDGTVTNSGASSTPTSPQVPNIGDAVRFTGTARYRAVWEESVITTFVPANFYNPFSSPTYTCNGNIIWKSNVGNAVGAEGVPVFPEKPQFDVPTPWIDVTATRTGSVP